ncbi:MAG: macro domain-containing protein [Candidatus Omnitrophica bacterium]|nr:macro domain-containing protein [Candidatus Omnitrophota bacterium]MCM8802457.1 macro domain-containing protein [Candidatus Omnitrophota bacterium]
MERIIKNVKVECVKGDIANQTDVICIVNAANAWLKPGGGVAGAIHSKAGPELEEECRKYAPIKPGDAVITKGYNLPNKYVIHCLGPVYGVDKPEDKILSDCYRNALKIAEEYKIDSIAFPAISTGAFGYPVKEAAEVALKTVLEIIPKLKYVKLIRFVLYSEKDLMVYKEVLAGLIEEK